MQGKNDLVHTKEKIWCGRRERFDASRGKDLTWNLRLSTKIVPALNARTLVSDRNHNTTAPTTSTVVLSALLSNKSFHFHCFEFQFPCNQGSTF